MKICLFGKNCQVSGHQLEAFFLRSSERRRGCERISEKIRQRFFLVHKCRVGAQTHPEEIRQRICGGGQLDDGATFWRRSRTDAGFCRSRESFSGHQKRRKQAFFPDVHD
uniref:Uncharacterized protein n=1 Tax=Toxoplasma gondii (strain ATCC 50861 / VEG) TaxID=432359 RepID=A0A0F7V8B8_TOXGV|nr:TPA: hypothetical protein BN1205_095460 [Toxoplasma gondii VEG]